MKKSLLLFALVATTFASFGQTKPPVKKPTTTAKPVVSKFGALAIDRSNGFYYGWSFDYATLGGAEKKAIEECNAKGGNCTVVLSYSGTGCAAYTTIDGNVGTAFGWGLAKTKEEADAIATKECLKRSNGTNPTNFVWSCNSTNTGILKEIYNASVEILPSVKIGTQEWTSQNLYVTTFKNGDAIPEAQTKETWEKAGMEGKPAWCYYDNDPKNADKYGKLYNWYAVTDPRGLALSGWHIPSDAEWTKLMDYLGGKATAGSKMKSIEGWEDNGNTRNESNFSGISGGSRAASGSFGDIGEIGEWWSSTQSTNNNIWCHSLVKVGVYEWGSSKYSEGSVSRWSRTKKAGFSVRLLKD